MQFKHFIKQSMKYVNDSNFLKLSHRTPYPLTKSTKIPSFANSRNFLIYFFRPNSLSPIYLHYIYLSSLTIRHPLYAYFFLIYLLILKQFNSINLFEYKIDMAKKKSYLICQLSFYLYDWIQKVTWYAKYFTINNEGCLSKVVFSIIRSKSLINNLSTKTENYR